MVACPACGEENPERAKFCSNCAAPLTVTAPPREVRKTVTVLFADVTGSTALGEQLDPEAVRALMGRYFAEAKRVIESHGGTVEKFIGDAVMAVFGIPRVHEDDALRAVRAAADLRTSLAELNVRLEADRGISIAVRTGVNTGEVVAGDPAGGQTLVTGDTVNTAARLEQAGAPGEILLGASTYRLVRDAVSVEAVEPIGAKGKAAPIEAWRFLEITGSQAHARHLEAPMVARHRELQLLADAYARTTSERAPRLFTVLGSAGLGKSRLITEFLAGLPDEAMVLKGRCLPYGESITYWPVREIVHSAAGIGEADAADAARAKLQHLLETAPDAELITRRVAAAIGLESEAAGQEEIFWAVRKLLEHLARQHPLVTLWEDIHWAEPTLLDLLDYIADLGADAPLLLLCAARPELLETRPNWGGGRPNAANEHLEALDADASADLIAALPGGAALPDVLRDRIASAAEGNPLYLEEMLGMLVDEGHLVPDDGQWKTIGDIADVSVPASVHALLGARIDSLPDRERQVAEHAAVAGRVFEAAAVWELATADARPAVAPSLLALVRKELVRPERSELTAGDAFKFRHILIRDAAYDALPKVERADLHERFANWLERVVANRLPEFEEIVGYHLEQAFRYRRELGLDDAVSARLGDIAAAHLATAASGAFDRSDLPAAAGLLRRALDSVRPDDPGRIMLAVELIDALMQIGRFQDATSLLEAAKDYPGCHDDARQRAWWELARLLVSFSGPGQYAIAEALNTIAAATETFEASSDIDGLARAWIARAHADWWQMQAAATIHALERALRYSRQGGRRSQELSILIWLIRAYWAGPTPVKAALLQLDEIRAAVELDRRIDASVRLSRAFLLSIAGETAEATSELDKATAIFAELQMATAVGEAGQAAYYIGLVTGDLDAARHRLEAANRELEQIGEEGFLSTNLGLLAALLFDSGEIAAAEEMARRAASISAPDDAAAQGQWRIVMAAVALERGDDERARSLAEEAISLLRGSDEFVVGDVLTRAAAIHLAAGDAPRGHALLSEALERYRAKGAKALAAPVETRMAELAG